MRSFVNCATCAAYLKGTSGGMRCHLHPDNPVKQGDDGCFDGIPKDHPSQKDPEDTDSLVRAACKAIIEMSRVLVRKFK